MTTIFIFGLYIVLINHFLVLNIDIFHYLGYNGVLG